MNSLALSCAIASNKATHDGFPHLAGAFAVLCRQSLAAPAPLILPKRPGVFGLVHPLDQLKATTLPLK